MIDDSDRSQLARYEAFVELSREMIAAVDLLQVAQLVVSRLKYVTNVHAWRFLGLEMHNEPDQIGKLTTDSHFLVIDGAGGKVSMSHATSLQLTEFELNIWKEGKAKIFDTAALAKAEKNLPEIFQNTESVQIYVCPHWETNQLRGLLVTSARTTLFDQVDIKFIGLVASFFHRKVGYLLNEQHLNEALVAAHNQTERANTALAEQLSIRTGELHVSDESLAQVRTDYQKAYPMAVMAALVPSLAHDLNTSVGNTAMVTSTMRDSLTEISHKMSVGAMRRTDLDSFLATLKEGLRIVETENVRISDLVSCLKQMSIDQATQRRRTFDVDQLIDEILITLSPTLRNRSVTIVRTIALELYMDSYPGPLSQVITNLVQNALVHAFEERTSGTITLLAEALANQRLRLVVEDNGKGMDAEIIGHLFEPFFTTKSGQGGSGIGLAFSRQLVEETLGGQLDVESTPGLGSRFIIELPCVAPSTSVH